MSRHKLVKSMNLHDELDDFDGGDNYDYDGNAGGNGGTPHPNLFLIFLNDLIYFYRA